MSNFKPWIPGQIPEDYEERVKTDTRKILEKTMLRVLSSDFNSQQAKSTQQSTQGKESSSLSQDKENKTPPSQADLEAGLKELFENDDDDDDCEEVIQQIFKRAKEAAKRHMEMKKKNPLLATLNLNMLPKKKTRKRKNKFEKNLEIMNNFKKSLIEPVEVPKPTQLNTTSTLTTVNSSNVISKPIINNSYPEENVRTVKIYPKWKTTATYTPIFSSTTNPNWTNLNHLAKSHKMYTPGPISGWMNGDKTDSHSAESPLFKSLRSNITSSAVKYSEKSIMNKETPIESDPTVSSAPKRSTIVRFKSISPEKIPWDSDGISSISSRSSMQEEINYDQFKNSHDENNDCILSPKQYKINNYLTPKWNEIVERYQKCSKKYTFSDKQHISKYQYETGIKSIETPILSDPLNSSTPIQNTNVCYRSPLPKNIPWKDDDTSISSISLMGENSHFKKYVDSDYENHQYLSKQCQHYPQQKKFFEINQEYVQKFNFTGNLKPIGSPLANVPWNSGDQLISPISLVEDKINFNQFLDSDDKYHQYYSKQHCQYPQKTKSLKVHQEFKETFNFTGKENSKKLQRNLTDAPFVMQTFVNNLTKKLNHNYNMEVKCSMKLKQKLF